MPLLEDTTEETVPLVADTTDDTDPLLPRAASSNTAPMMTNTQDFIRCDRDLNDYLYEYSSSTLSPMSRHKLILNHKWA